MTIDINSDLACCGINEIHNINYSKPEQTIKEICINYHRDDNQCAFYLFTDINKKTDGKKLEKYIKKHKLGTITKSRPSVNPNSKNSLKIWLWTINKRNLKTLWRTKYKEEFAIHNMWY